MKTSSSGQWIVYLAWLLILTASAEDTPSQPIQFCKQDEALQLDFCMAATPYQNTTSASTDLYVTITRTHSSSHGWLGVGLGPAMTGALMFILYDENSAMTTSIRTGMGHYEPIELSAMGFIEGQYLPEIRVIKSAYDDGPAPDSSSSPDRATKPRTGTAHILIYSLDLWPKSTIVPTSPSQPWIWAHNPISPTSSTGGKLQTHSHTPNTGFGFFWTDFASALSPSTLTPPSFPVPNPSTGPHLSTAIAPPIYRLGGPTILNWMFHLHGLLASLSFLLLYPLGALLLRTADARAFNFHWTTQAFASVLFVLGAMLGWTLSRRIELVHQVLGLVVLGGVWCQVALGWRGHVRFLRTKRGNWMGKMHVWMGRALMGTGWVNVLLGLRVRGYGVVTLVAAGLVVMAEAGVMLRVLGSGRRISGLWSKKTKGSAGPGARARAGVAGGGAGGLGEEYFELVGHDEVEEEEDEDYDEDGRLKADVEWEERMRGGGGGSIRPEGGSGGDKARKLQRLDAI